MATPEYIHKVNHNFVKFQSQNKTKNSVITSLLSSTSLFNQTDTFDKIHLQHDGLKCCNTLYICNLYQRSKCKIPPKFYPSLYTCTCRSPHLICHDCHTLAICRFQHVVHSPLFNRKKQHVFHRKIRSTANYNQISPYLFSEISL